MSRESCEVTFFSTSPRFISERTSRVPAPETTDTRPAVELCGSGELVWLLLGGVRVAWAVQEIDRVGDKLQAATF
jgi:hypothetical protein